MAKEQGGRFFEKPLKVYERFNRFLGGVALLGAAGAVFIAPEAVPFLAGFGVLQFVEAEVIKKI